MLLIGVPGPELTSDFAKAVRRCNPAGFILFTRNIRSPEQFRKLLDDLRDLSRDQPILTSDQEGGRVSRLREIGNEPPSAWELFQTGRPDLALQHGRLTAQLMRLFGLNLDLCPVLDICFDPDADNSLRNRCYGNDAPSTIAFAAAFQTGLREGGILSCGKHFPGYSRAQVDPHHELPSVALERRELEEHEFKVFRHFSAGPDAADSMMIGHAHYPALDSERIPTSLSHRVVTGVLRGELGFKGLIMTDDLDMGAVIEELGFEDTILRAVHAGNDLLMICHRLEMAEQAARILDGLTARDRDGAMERLEAFRSRLQPPAGWNAAAHTEIDEEIRALRVAALGEERAAARSPEDGKRSPVEIY